MVKLLTNRARGEKTYFDVDTSLIKTIQAYFGFMEDKVHEIISRSIVENVINVLLESC